METGGHPRERPCPHAAVDLRDRRTVRWRDFQSLFERHQNRRDSVGLWLVPRYAPWEDNEFNVGVPGRELQTSETSVAHGKIDLLTVVMREFGREYLKDKQHTPQTLQPLMEGTLSP